MALVNFDTLKDEAARAEIEMLTHGYADKGDYFIDELFQESDPAVLWMIKEVIERAHKAGAKVVKYGIDSISVTPDSFLAVKRHVADAEG